MKSPDIGNVIPEGMIWAADNGCFHHPESFDVEVFLSWLAIQPYQNQCLFAVAPDVVGDWQATMERSLPVLPRIRKLGYNAAFVGQDGLTEPPWDEFDCFFIGGSTEWKLSEDAYRLVEQAIKRNKWVHMGRVNSERRFKAAMTWGCHSVDGTFLRFGPTINWPRLEKWLMWRSLIYG